MKENTIAVRRPNVKKKIKHESHNFVQLYEMFDFFFEKKMKDITHL